MAFFLPRRNSYRYLIFDKEIHQQKRPVHFPHILLLVFFGVSQAGLEINRNEASYFNYIFAQALTQLVFTR